jgi:hypothetical protein
MGLLADEELDRTLAKAPTPEPTPEPLIAGPTTASVSTEMTTSGLPRRGGATVDAAVLEDELPSTLEVEPEAPAPPVEPDPVVATDPSPAPTPPSSLPASGFGGLAVSRPPGPSMYTLAGQQGRQEVNGEATQERPEANGTATPGGLARRIPGAQRPDAGLTARAPEAAAEPARTSPEDVYSFLSNFQSGVARGRADAGTDTPTNQEDGR